MLLGFKKRFVKPIEQGTKVFTMRNRRKRMPKIGETLHMYTALRTQYCELISNHETLKSIQKVTVSITKEPLQTRIFIIVDGWMLNPSEVSRFVQCDGFTDESDFADYWLKESKAKGKVKRVHANLDLYHWTDLKF